MSWWFPQLPLGRVAALRVIVYLFVWYDVFVYSPQVGDLADVPTAYQPLAIERVLHLPTPTHGLALAVQILLPCVATLAATGRAPRVLGAATFLLYLDWITMGDSFGYVAHDRFAFLVALAVLPTVGAARRGDRRTSQRAGWALRCIQVAVVATYFLSSWAKFRFGGLHWADGSVLTWALLRRGTSLGRPLLDHPAILHVSQWGIVCAEMLSPVVLFLRGRFLYLVIATMLVFHLVSYETIRISFLPHVLCLFAFLPIERLGGRGRPLTGAAVVPAARVPGSIPVLVYDGDCAFCTTSARRIAARWGGSAQIQPWQAMTQPQLRELGLTVDDVRQMVWWVDEHGVRSGGHTAVARALVQAGGWRRLVGLLVASRALAGPAAMGYRLVARNRHRLPGATDACRVDEPA